MTWTRDARSRGPPEDGDVDFKVKLGDFAAMAKYDPLLTYLKRQKADALELSFREIENLIGYLLPKSASQPAWWANADDGAPARAVQRRAWLLAGYHASLLPCHDRVSFTRAEV